MPICLVPALAIPTCMPSPRLLVPSLPVCPIPAHVPHPRLYASSLPPCPIPVCALSLPVCPIPASIPCPRLPTFPVPMCPIPFCMSHSCLHALCLPPCPIPASMPHPCLPHPGGPSPACLPCARLRAPYLPALPIPPHTPHRLPHAGSLCAPHRCLPTLRPCPCALSSAARSVPARPVPAPAPACPPRTLRCARSLRAPGEARGRWRRAGADRRRRLPASLPAARQRGAAPPRTSLPCGARRRRAPRAARRGAQGRPRSRRGAAERAVPPSHPPRPPCPVHHAGAPREQDGRGGGAAPGHCRLPARPRPGAPRRRAGKGVRGLARLPLGWAAPGRGCPAPEGRRELRGARRCAPHLRPPRDAPVGGAGAALPRAAAGLLLGPQVATAGARRPALSGGLAGGSAGSCVCRADDSGRLRQAGFTALWKGGWEGRC